MSWQVVESPDKTMPLITNGDLYLCSCGTPINNRWCDACEVARYLNEEEGEVLNGWIVEIAAGDPRLVNARSGGCIVRDTWENTKRSPVVKKELLELFADLPSVELEAGV